tara:strand:+ start:3167 stop:3301 length:135 start_codon:yes stop_codon:yes gene_type:complete
MGPKDATIDDTNDFREGEKNHEQQEEVRETNLSDSQEILSILVI